MDSAEGNDQIVYQMVPVRVLGCRRLTRATCYSGSRAVRWTYRSVLIIQVRRKAATRSRNVSVRLQARIVKIGLEAKREIRLISEKASRPVIEQRHAK